MKEPVALYRYGLCIPPCTPWNQGGYSTGLPVQPWLCSHRILAAASRAESWCQGTKCSPAPSPTWPWRSGPCVGFHSGLTCSLFLLIQSTAQSLHHSYKNQRTVLLSERLFLTITARLMRFGGNQPDDDWESSRKVLSDGILMYLQCPKISTKQPSVCFMPVFPKSQHSNLLIIHVQERITEPDFCWMNFSTLNTIRDIYLPIQSLIIF